MKRRIRASFKLPETLLRDLYDAVRVLKAKGQPVTAEGLIEGALQRELDRLHDRREMNVRKGKQEETCQTT